MAARRSAGAKVRGVEALRRKFARIEKAVGPVAFSAAMAAAETIRQAAREEAPVLSGKLRDNIEIRPLPYPDEVTVGVWGDAFAGDFYPAYVEYGTPHSAPNRFMTRAYERCRDACRRRMKFILAVGIEAEARGS